ncbi:MAG TPA: hypothetical protein VGO50_02895 [Pyrinomonadaceae bacterium]|jgi:hypothetical protein|nr:hypothetical protein [Pyrinomonadaceae bacterium]
MGYFSRIAGQSGIRFSGESKTPGTGKVRAGGSPAPLDREETVFVSSSEKAERVSDVSEQISRQSPQQSPEQRSEDRPRAAAQGEPFLPPEQLKNQELRKQDPEVRENAPANLVVRIADPVVESVTGPRRKSAQESMRESVQGSIPESVPEKKLGVLSKKVSQEENAPAEMPAGKIETPGRIIEKTADAKNTPESPRNAKQEIAADIIVSELTSLAEPVGPGTPELNVIEIEAPVKANENQYFAKTAEIIERRDLSAAEIQNIVFQEVIDWAAASPSETEESQGSQAAQAIKAAQGTEAAQATDVAHAIEITRVNTSEMFADDREFTSANAEPGVITITGKKEPERADIEKERAAGERDPGYLPLEEQSFELSIGTISVVIENEESPPQKTLIDPQERSDRNTGQEAGRGSSRLSRSYL